MSAPDRPPEPILHVDLDAFYASVADPQGSVAQGEAGDRRRDRFARGRHQRLVRGEGDTGCAARCRRSARAVCARRASSSHPTSTRIASIRSASGRSCSPTPRSWSRSPWTRRSWTSAAPPCCSARRWRSRTRIRQEVAREVGDHLLGGHRPDQVRREARLGRMQARRAAPRAHRGGRGLPRTAPRRAALGRGGEDRRSCWGAWRSAPSGTSGGRPRRSSSGSSARRRRATSARWRTGIDDRPVVPVRATEVDRSRGDVRPGSRRRGRDPARAAGAVGAGGGSPPRGRVPIEDVTLKVRLANFTTLTRSRTQADPTDLGADLHRIVSELYRALPGAKRRVRLLGVQAGGLVPAGAQQLALLDTERWDDVERTVDRIERRFGPGAAGPASLLDRSPSPVGSAQSEPLSIIVGERVVPYDRRCDAPQRARTEDPRGDRATALGGRSETRRSRLSHRPPHARVGSDEDGDRRVHPRPRSCSCWSASPSGSRPGGSS